MKVVICLMLFGISSAVVAAPNIQVELEKRELAQFVRAGDWKAMQAKIDDMRARGIDLGKEIIFFEGRGAFERGKFEMATAKFTQYINVTNGKGHFYSQALDYLARAKAEVDRQRAVEQARREAEEARRQAEAAWLQKQKQAEAARKAEEARRKQEADSWQIAVNKDTAAGWQAYLGLSNTTTAHRDEAGKRLAAIELRAQQFKDCPACPPMMVVPAGDFPMGDMIGDGRPREKPVHSVHIAKPFALGAYEVTVAEFKAFVKATDYKTKAEAWNGKCETLVFGRRHYWEQTKGVDWTNARMWGVGKERFPEIRQRDNHPVVCVSWNDAQAYVRWLAKESAKPYRLPSEAEWEYAARAGRISRWPWGNDANQSCTYANMPAADSFPSGGRNWTDESRPAKCKDHYTFTAPVGSYAPNRWGLFDLVGNVSEWTGDCFHESYDGAPTDGSMWLDGSCKYRIMRGSNFSDTERLTHRGRWSPDSSYTFIGIRVARDLGAGDAHLQQAKRQ